MDPAVLDSTPEMILNIPQPDFEQYLSEELSKQSVAEIWKGISFVSLEEHEDTVTTLLEERDTGKLYKVRSKFVIACDGAKSKVREVIGTKTDGEDSCKHIAHLLVACDQANIW
jgi:2-polyprenyl-6-methoxyphenol hydroxylase-like FAD-dependent oxidoreductase